MTALSTTGVRRYVLMAYFLLQAIFIFCCDHAYLLRVDDAYYYFALAYNFVDSGQFTFDGTHLTNGFQALWQFLLIAVTSLCKMVGMQSLDHYVKVYFLICALLNTGSAFIGFQISDKSFSRSPRSAAVFMFALLWIPGLSTSLLSGMENSLNWLLLLCLVNLLADRSGGFCLPQMGLRLVWVILVSIMLVYTRVDNTIILLCIAIFAFLKSSLHSRMYVIFAWGAATAVAWAPLLIWQSITFGMATPISGSVKIWTTLKWIHNNGVEAYLLSVVKAFVLSFPGIVFGATGMGYYEIIKPAVFSVGFDNTITGLALLSLIVLIGTVVLIRRVGRVRWPSVPGLMSLLVVVSIVHVAVNSVMFPRQWKYAGLIWYYLVSYLLFFLLIGWVGGAMMDSLSAVAWQRVKRVAIAVFFIATVPMIIWRSDALTEQELKYAAAHWMSDNLEDGAVVAAYNAGVTGFYSEVPVINLDGLVNSREYFEQYLKPDRVLQYVRENGVTHLADHGCPKDGAVFRNLVRVPEDGKVVFTRLGNEPGLDFCIVELVSKSPSHSSAKIKDTLVMASANAPLLEEIREKIHVLWLFVYKDLDDRTLSSYDMVIINASYTYRAHIYMFELVRRYRRLRPDGIVITDERWDLIGGKRLRGSARRSPLPAPEEIGGWNPNWLAEPRPSWPSLRESIAKINASGHRVRLRQFLRDYNHQPLIGTKTNYLPYFWYFDRDGSVRLDVIKCRVSAPGYLAWRVAFAVRWQQIIGADGILVGTTKQHQYWDDDKLPKGQWVAEYFTPTGLSRPPQGRKHLCPTDETFSEFSAGMFELPLRPEFGDVPRFGLFSHAMAIGRNREHINRHLNGQINTYWYKHLIRSMDACRWWAVHYDHISGRDDTGKLLRRLAQRAIDGGQKPLLFLQRSTLVGQLGDIPNAGELHFDHMRRP